MLVLESSTLDSIVEMGSCGDDDGDGDHDDDDDNNNNALNEVRKWSLKLRWGSTQSIFAVFSLFCRLNFTDSFRPPPRKT